VRRWFYGSLGGHVVALGVAAILSTAFQQSAAPSAEFMTIDLAQLEIPRPNEVEQPEPIPEPPAEVEVPTPETQPEQPENLPEPEIVEDVVPPEPDLPPEPKPDPKPKTPEPEEALDLPEPEQIQRRETPPPTEVADESPAEALDEGTSMRMRAPEGMVDYYYATLRRKIARQWRPDQRSARGRRDVETIISFRVGRVGEILDAEILQSSGFSVFDRQCLRAVMSANPLPKPPSSYLHAGSLPIELIFGYNQ